MNIKSLFVVWMFYSFKLVNLEKEFSFIRLTQWNCVLIALNMCHLHSEPWHCVCFQNEVKHWKQNSQSFHTKSPVITSSSSSLGSKTELSISRDGVFFFCSILAFIGESTLANYTKNWQYWTRILHDGSRHWVYWYMKVGQSDEAW